MQQVRKEEMLSKWSMVVEHVTETGRIFLPTIYGVCMYKYAHAQSCTTFCTLRLGLFPGLGLFPAWFWAARGAHSELWEVLYTPLSPPGCCSCLWWWPWASRFWWQDYFLPIFFNDCCLGLLSLCFERRDVCFECRQLLLVFLLVFEKKCSQKSFWVRASLWIKNAKGNCIRLWMDLWLNFFIRDPENRHSY